MENIKKLYIAYKAGYLGDNILNTYFSFLANMISEEHLSIIEDTVIAEKFKERYSIELPLPFLRQVLGVGVNNNCFIEDRGKYNVVIEELDKFHFSETDFNEKWNLLINSFKSYCEEINIDVHLEIEDFILSELDKTDDKILSGEKVEYSLEDDKENNVISPIEYAWYSFIRIQGQEKTDLFTFISALSASNITRQALFYFGDKKADYSGLHVYLDSPIVFALLGMDEEYRTKSYCTLVEDLLKANCSVHVLDHVFQEIDGIITRAASWATNTQYDLRKANSAARFFHDTRMSDSDISEFCSNIETKLNELGITIIQTDYDIFQNNFQEDEAQLLEMIKEKYLENGFELLHEKEESIRVDVRSIIMIYRQRQGQTATRLQNAKHIMLTTNNAIANVSKKYESNRSIQAGHIPACVSVDLFGAILWLDTPMQFIEYQKHKLLADCYAFLKPDKVLLDKYIQSLDDARNADAIDEKKYLFLRTHPVVLDSLMNITRGDYASFNSNTYLEVYDDIQAKSQKLFKDEKVAHEQTQKQLEKLEEISTNERREKEQEITLLNERISSLEHQEEMRKQKEFNKKVTFWGWVCSILIVGIPYFILLIIIELVKTIFSDITLRSAIGIGGALLITIIAGIVWSKSKECIFNKVRIYFENKTQN